MKKIGSNSRVVSFLAKEIDQNGQKVEDPAMKQRHISLAFLFLLLSLGPLSAQSSPFSLRAYIAPLPFVNWQHYKVGGIRYDGFGAIGLGLGIEYDLPMAGSIILDVQYENGKQFWDVLGFDLAAALSGRKSGRHRDLNVIALSLSYAESLLPYDMLRLQVGPSWTFSVYEDGRWKDGVPLGGRVRSVHFSLGALVGIGSRPLSILGGALTLEGGAFYRPTFIHDGPGDPFWSYWHSLLPFYFGLHS